MLKRGVMAVCLLLCMDLVWIGAVGSFRPDTAALDAGKARSPQEIGLEEMIRQIFTGRGCMVKVQKVDWEVEELPQRLWARMEQWQEYYANTPRALMGYIELLDEPAREAGEDFLWEYATVQHESAQETFLVADSGIYQISSLGSNGLWQSCMRELLSGVPQWQISKDEAGRYIHGLDFEKYERYSDPPYGKLELWYQGISVTFYEDSRLLAYRRDRERVSPGEKTDSGRECLWFQEKWNEQELEWQFCTAKSFSRLPYEELLKRLQVLHPGLWNCVFYTRETGEYDAWPLIDLMTEDGEYVYYYRRGQWYQVSIRPTEDVGGRQGLFNSKGSGFRYDLGYSYQESYGFQVTEQGDITETDQIQHRHYLEQEMRSGLRLCFDCQVKDEYRGEFFIDYTYEVAVSRPGEEEPFQILEVSSAEWEPFSFEDFNADGWLDLRVLYYYGANGGTASHYIWSPSKGEFVRGPEDLEYFGTYGIDQEKRQLHMHYHGSASSGTEALYQWSGETDCELIRRFNHDDVNNYQEMLDYLFLFREDTYLICALEHQEAPAAYTGLSWNEEQAFLTVSYAGGQKQYYQWDGETFIIPLETGIY